MSKMIIRFFWPGISDIEIKKFGLLSLTFFCAIGSYWLLRLLKDIVFMKIAFPISLGWPEEQGVLYQPVAKTWSPLVIIVCVALYSKLVDVFSKQKLFYVVCSFYMLLFTLIAMLLLIRDLYSNEFLGKTTLSAMGWITYFGVESYGSVIIPLFWSFVVSITNEKSAKIGFPLIIVGAQLGGVFGSSLSLFAKEAGGVWCLFAMSSAVVFVMMIVMHYFIKTMPKSQMRGSLFAEKLDREEQEKKKESFMEGFYSGLKLIISNPYLLGVLIVSCVYEVIVTIVDFQMKRQASMHPDYSGEIGFAKFMGIFGISVNGLTFVLALFGTGYFLRKFGLKICLLVFPVLFGISLIILFAICSSSNPSQSELLWTTFSAVVLARGLAYGVNNPTKEMLYIPTSKDARFKAKGWIDMFGARTAKMGGSRITNALKGDLTTLFIVGTVAGIGIVIIWITAALYVGRKNQQMLSERNP